ncbi:MAG TPA: hypothetical protein ENH25_06565 [candidate division Zixibacteria bacterium]|nr:hypothetical protein [candidate division Zixibacteria bacterium]
MRRLLIFLISSLLLGLFILGGCDFLNHDIEGPERGNVPPVVQFVNIPVEKAKFMSDTTIYWYGTDVDGFIVQFRYAVVEEEIVGSDPDAYIAGTPDSLIPWVNLDVQLDDPQTNARITMSADISDPVRTYVASYVFLQAVDNLGSKSAVVYRLFYKNNHFPNTSITSRDANDPYVNTVTIGGVLDGVTISWSAEDPIDYPRDPPPFQFQWRFYGPYDSLQMMELDSICVGSVFVDIYGDFYLMGDTFMSLGDPDTFYDTTQVPPQIDSIVVDTSWIKVDTLGRNNPYGSWNDFLYLDSLQEYSYLNKLVDSSYDPLTDDIWVYDQNTHIYDVYRNETIDTTSQYYFLMWCQARDDSKVPDPVPAFNWVSVIEPRFERTAIIIDATSYKTNTSGFFNWPVFPNKPYDNSTEPIVKRVLGQMIDDWAGAGSFDFETFPEDILYSFPDGTRCRIQYKKYFASQDYYPISKLTKCDNYGISAVSLRDILKHKIVIVVKDNPGGELIMDNAIMLSVLDGLNAGMSAWSMVRSPFQGYVYVDTVTWQDVPTSYMEYFGVINMRFSGWQGAINDITQDENGTYINAGTRIEDFVGAIPLLESSDFIDLPHLAIDTNLLEDRYLWVDGSGFNQYDYRCPDPDNPPGEVLIGALPEVGYVRKSLLAEARYLYESKYGNEPAFLEEYCGRKVGIWEKANGSVVGITYNTGLFRTAHFSFSLLPLEEENAQQCFNNVMDWLSVQPFIQTGKMAPAMVTPKVDVQKLRDITEDLHLKKKQGLLRSYGEQ